MKFQSLTHILPLTPFSHQHFSYFRICAAQFHSSHSLLLGNTWPNASGTHRSVFPSARDLMPLRHSWECWSQKPQHCLSNLVLYFRLKKQLLKPFFHIPLHLEHCLSAGYCYERLMSYCCPNQSKEVQRNQFLHWLSWERKENSLPPKFRTQISRVWNRESNAICSLTWFDPWKNKKEKNIVCYFSSVTVWFKWFSVSKQET